MNIKRLLFSFCAFLFAGIGGGSDGYPGTISIGLNTQMIAVSDGKRPALGDDGDTLEGDGYVMLLNYLTPKPAGTTNTLCLQNWEVVTNIVAAITYQSLALSLAQTNTYRVLCSNIAQKHELGTDFLVGTTGLAVFTDVTDSVWGPANSASRFFKVLVDMPVQ